MRTTTTTTAPRYLSRARFSASDRPIPPDFDVDAVIDARRAARAATPDAPPSRWVRWIEAFITHLAGVRRSAGLALALMLATGSGEDADEGATQGARS
jgi:hypothetical protein